jgi:hypothetical protein
MEKIRIRDGKIRIRDKHPGSAILLVTNPDPDVLKGRRYPRHYVM